MRKTIRIGVDGTIQLAKHGTGITLTIEVLLQTIARIDPTFHFYVYIADDAYLVPSIIQSPNISFIQVGSGKSIVHRLQRDIIDLPKKIAQDNIDVFWSPNNYYLPFQRRVPIVLTLYDLSFLLSPKDYSFYKRAYYKVRLFHALRSAAAVITISETTRQRLTDRFPTSSSKVFVSPLGPPSYLEGFNSRQPFILLEPKNYPSKYLLSVGTHPRKNWSVIVDALAILRNRNKDFNDIKLVLVGPEYLFQPRGDTHFGNLVQYTGFISKSALVTLYRNAIAYVTASKDEGFGLTILEAMYMGTPVICSDIRAHRETAGSAALYFPSDSPGQLADILSQLLLSSKKRAYLRQLGDNNINRFSWEKCAQKYCSIFRALAP